MLGKKNIRYFKQTRRLSQGRILDIGFYDRPNPEIPGLFGLDWKADYKPANYSNAIKADALQLPLKPGTFDTIIATELIEHLENPSEFLRQCHGALKREGLLILSTPNPYYPPLIFLNALMIKKFFFRDSHLNLFPPRILFKVLKKCGFHLDQLRSGSGIVLPTKNHFTLPFFRALSQHLVYICRKITE